RGSRSRGPAARSHADPPPGGGQGHGSRRRSGVHPPGQPPRLRSSRPPAAPLARQHFAGSLLSGEGRVGPSARGLLAPREAAGLRTPASGCIRSGADLVPRARNLSREHLRGALRRARGVSASRRRSRGTAFRRGRDDGGGAETAARGAGPAPFGRGSLRGVPYPRSRRSGSRRRVRNGELPRLGASVSLGRERREDRAGRPAGGKAGRPTPAAAWLPNSSSASPSAHAGGSPLRRFQPSRASHPEAPRGLRGGPLRTGLVGAGGDEFARGSHSGQPAGRGVGV